jgi:hypothetical protein
MPDQVAEEIEEEQTDFVRANQDPQEDQDDSDWESDDEDEEDDVPEEDLYQDEA